MKLISATALLALVVAGAIARKDNPDKRTFAVLRFTNKQLTYGRADPIVSPNKLATHVHNVLGGSNFGLGSSGKDLLASNCSTALVKGDYSNYWFPSLYFVDPKTGKFEDVELFYANVYYFFEPSNDDIKAFPVGLSIVSGDQTLRSPPEDGATSNLDPSKGPLNPVKWTCPRTNLNQAAYPADSDGKMAGIADPNNKGEGVGFPDVNCDGYASPLRGDIHFPSCFNPEKGLTNYKENMVFPSDTGDGKQDCPKGHVHVPHLFLEVYWNTPAFKDRWTPGQGKQPFVLSNGDATGYSNHADFMAGWDEDLLQGIIDHCDKGSAGMDQCTEQLKYGLNKGDCTIPSPVDEVVSGVLSALPGNNEVTGWKYGLKGVGGGGSSGVSASQSLSKFDKGGKSATPSSNNADDGDKSTGANNHETKSSDIKLAKGAQMPTSQSAANITITAGDFKYAGCFKDSPERVLNGVIRANLGAVSNENCVSSCKGAGFALAGTEYGGQCYCGNELIGSQKIDESKCHMACEGNKAGICGGDWALSVFSRDGQASLKSSKQRRHAYEHFWRHRSKRY